jgi:hypothetical protein
MSANDQPQTNKPTGSEGEVRPSPDKNVKLEEKIGDEKDNEAVRLWRSNDDA